MITPLEIQEKEFSRALKGFKEDEVNEFLDEITLDLERLIEEYRQMKLANEQLKEENAQLKKELQEVQDSQHSVINTLETAKALMADISASAEKRAQILLKNAELESQTMIREAKETVARMNDEHVQLRSRLTGFRRKYKEMLENELNELERSSKALNDELKVEDFSDLPGAKPAAAKPATSAYPKETMVNPKK